MSAMIPSSHHDTIVVGAGIAGLTAARLLTRAGQRVVILEARDRIGGRVHTQRTADTVTDLGASWIHGIDDAPLYAVTQAFGMRTVEFTLGSYQPDSRPVAYYDPDGRRLTDAQTAEFAGDIHIVDGLLTEFVSTIGPGTSYGSAVDHVLAQCGWSDERCARVREYLRHRTEEQYGVWIDDLDAHGLDDDETVGEEVVFPDGYDRLASHLGDGLTVRFDHVVSRVDWNRSGVTVASSQGTFTADRVVVTVPVGILKSGALSFHPPLPEPVSGALSRLEMNAFEGVPALSGQILG